ncbi:DNA-binding HxlR family transcriptional regulator [Flavobacterium gossypii]|jgi:DNA-binding HxlR family transcriptional regulator|uniref:DNA-binding HxlR family transcriptional regulator n=2 Tax=Flavobacterium TaxID=237 RepID=A0A495M734_9FLAO|nr:MULTISPECIES: helix-turn-helix domain-containing protein [Flavobacterium]MBA9074592.1 DNA-binding HxlR family transcriptional regulator [Flavobacterium gossypii]RKS21801.1 DNA-binding HxlR family transcriptional regulator [Flavobacterium endophyticum]
MSQKNLTTEKLLNTIEICPAQGLLRMLSGKWKPEIFYLAIESDLRFNSLLRMIEGSNKQSLAVALKELVEAELLEKVVVKQKPLHIEYFLTERGKSLIPVFRQLERIAVER